MSIHRYCLYTIAAAAGVTPMAASSAPAEQAYPAKPVRLVVAAVAGGTVDIVARMIANGVHEDFRQHIVVEPRPSPLVTLPLVAKSTPDGYTIVATPSEPFVIAPHLVEKLPYDPIRDFAPVSLAAAVSFMLAVHPSVPAMSLRELIAIVKERPDSMRYGSNGQRSVSHLTTEMLRMVTGAVLLHVPYRGGPAAVRALASGEVAFVITAIPNLMPYVREGRLRALAVTAAKRSSIVPDVPTVAETGYPGFDAGQWYGFFAPRQTPAERVNKLAAELARASRSAGVAHSLERQGVEAIGAGPEELAAHLRRNAAQWKKVIEDTGAGRS